ncbi:hypothetical protein TNCV_4264921 [Trichonephila clavipes]|nr:hypothetical protein TNCV_4264921 [Trichonephila clavipes]
MTAFRRNAVPNPRQKLRLQLLQPLDLRNRLFNSQMYAPKKYMVVQICVRGQHHAGTTCVKNPVRKLHLLKNRLTVQALNSTGNCTIRWMSSTGQSSGIKSCRISLISIILPIQQYNFPVSAFVYISFSRTRVHNIRKPLYAIANDYTTDF